jgi:hypothetical protein
MILVNPPKPEASVTSTAAPPELFPVAHGWCLVSLPSAISLVLGGEELENVSGPARRVARAPRYLGMD